MAFIDLQLDFSLSKTEQEKLNKHTQKQVMNQIITKLKNAVGYFELNIQYKLQNLIEQSPEFQELISGKLRFDMGITLDEAVAVTQRIPEIISKTLKVEIVRSSDLIQFVVRLITEGYQDILSIKEASFIQLYTSKSPYSIPWLEWLLLQGDKMIVTEHHIKYVSDNPNSRSGGAIMVGRGSWRVPPQFAGTSDNNMITRALESIDEFINEEIQKFL